jgi:phosphohistidine swiveling domain-containing protein
MTDSHAAPMTPMPIPAPEDFPVQWSQEEEAQLHWIRDRMHFPQTVSPALDLFFEAHNAGFVHAFALYEMPLEALVLRRINGYAYNAVVPRKLTHDEMAAMGKRAQQNLGAAMMRSAQHWNDELLPEVKDHLRFWQDADLEGATLDELLELAAETRRRWTRLWEIHFELMVPTLLAGSLFQETYADLFGAERAFDAFTLLQGFGNKTTEINIALWRLARSADEDVRATILGTDPAAVAALLRESESGRRFLASFEDYLQAYGRRSETWELNRPSWIEDPTPVWRMLREHLSQPDADPAAELARLADQREAALADTRASLTGYPQPVVDHFEAMLRAAQDGAVLSEDHGFYIDFEGAYHVRRVLLEFGRRMAEAGALASTDDITMLTLDEVLASVREQPFVDRRGLVEERRRDLAHFGALQEPEMVGTRQPGPPPEDPVGRAIGRFFGTPPQASADPEVLNGHAGSPGVVRGVARVARSLSEAQDVRRGEILVTTMTAPSWTPLFGTVAGVVTDTGGALSHSAVVAREYGIPAVVGTLRATTLIRDGQLIEIDGSAGTVRLVERTSDLA